MEQYSEYKKRMLNLYVLIEESLKPLMVQISFQTVYRVWSICIKKKLRTCIWLYRYRNSKSVFIPLWPVYTFSSHFMSFYLFKKKFFFYHEYALILLKDRREGGRGCHGERGREEEREKRERGEKKAEGGREKSNNQATNQPMVATWQYGFSQSENDFAERIT